MKIGFMMVYNEVDWVGYAIDQAVQICDRLIICEGAQFTSHQHISERSIDGTLDIISDKIKQYTNFIELVNTVRTHSNYRNNQCDNFNNALNKCKEGDYFLPLDVDVFYTDVFISELNTTLSYGSVDVVKVNGNNFAFSFNWKRCNSDGSFEVFNHEAAYKKISGAHFVPTHQPRNFGNSILIFPDTIFHYTWVKPYDRMRVRMETSNFTTGMLKWFDDNWNRVKLIEGRPQLSHLGNMFSLKKYLGTHPSVLKDHPWLNVNDIRSL